MRALVWIIILFAAAVGIALLVQNFSGTVHFVLAETIYSINLYAFIVGLLIIWFLWHIIWGIVQHTVGIPHFLRRFSRKRSLNQAEHLLNETGMAFFEGRYQKAQQLAEKLLNNKHAADKLPLALIFAAYSADETGNIDARDHFLAKMEKLPQYNALPTHLLLGNSALLQHDLPTAQEHIQAALAINSHLTQALKLNLAYALETEDGKTILKLTDLLYKNGALSNKEAKQHRLFAYRQYLMASKDAKSIKRCLKAIPEAIKEELVVDIARQYQKLSLFSDVVKWIKKYYPQQYNVDLLPVLHETFALLSERMQNKVLNSAEGWLNNHPKDASLLLTLGEMSAQKALWAKAKGYFEESLALEQNVSAHLNLAKVLTEMQEDDEAKEHRLIALDLIDQGERLAEDEENTDAIENMDNKEK